MGGAHPSTPTLSKWFYFLFAEPHLPTFCALLAGRHPLARHHLIRAV